ncbi:MAG TPA: hypothetical protein VGQ20_17985 [Acidimicrobiales bacterium]|jgi:hypothetical protein|nr:hypothetical protein [Acidimicrobiales bacterium]
MSDDDAYLGFLEYLRSGAPITEAQWLFHFDHQNANPQSGPDIGETTPDFALPDQHGRPRTRAELMGERGLLLVFARSADW